MFFFFFLNESVTCTSKQAAHPLFKFTFSMVLKILKDFKGQLTVARTGPSAEGSMPCVRGLPALGSPPYPKQCEPVGAPGISGQELLPREGLGVWLVNF